MCSEKHGCTSRLYSWVFPDSHKIHLRWVILFPWMTAWISLAMSAISVSKTALGMPMIRISQLSLSDNEMNETWSSHTFIVLIWKSQSVHKWGLRGSLKFQVSKMVSSICTIKDSRVLNNYFPKASKKFFANIIEVLKNSLIPLLWCISKVIQRSPGHIILLVAFFPLFIGFSAMTLFELIFLCLAWKKPGRVYKRTWPMIYRSERVKHKLIILTAAVFFLNLKLHKNGSI